MPEWLNGTVSPRDGKPNVAAFDSERIITQKTVKKVNMGYFVYILQSANFDKLYIGSSANPDKRLADHNAGKAKWSRNFRPWKRIWLEELENKTVALKREKYLKSGWGRRWIETNVRNKVEDIN